MGNPLLFSIKGIDLLSGGALLLCIVLFTIGSIMKGKGEMFAGIMVKACTLFVVSLLIMTSLFEIVPGGNLLFTLKMVRNGNAVMELILRFMMFPILIV